MIISNMVGVNGKSVSNQFVINSSLGVTFQSYKSIVAYKSNNGVITLDSKYWNYSRTTNKYLCKFLECTSKELQDRVKKGVYTLTNLNP